MQHQMPTPPLLRAGDVVDVVAPGFRCTQEHLEKGIAFLERAGLVPRVPPDLFGEDLLCANSDARRFAHLRKALFARDSRAVWCVRGGYGAIRIIQRLQSLQPPRRPKLLIGYSDATTLHQLLNLHWDGPHCMAPCWIGWAAPTSRDAEQAELHAVLFGAAPQITFTNLVR